MSHLRTCANTIVLSRDQIAAFIRDVRERSKAIMLQFENPVSIIERCGRTGRDDEPDCGKTLHDSILAVAPSLCKVAPNPECAQIVLEQQSQNTFGP